MPQDAAIIRKQWETVDKNEFLGEGWRLEDEELIYEHHDFTKELVAFTEIENEC